jgi:hypothetical protein
MKCDKLDVNQTVSRFDVVMQRVSFVLHDSSSSGAVFPWLYYSNNPFKPTTAFAVGQMQHLSSEKRSLDHTPRSHADVSNSFPLQSNAPSQPIFIARHAKQQDAFSLPRSEIHITHQTFIQIFLSTSTHQSFASLLSLSPYLHASGNTCICFSQCNQLPPTPASTNRSLNNNPSGVKIS